jgi:hypothetical protein
MLLANNKRENALKGIAPLDVSCQSSRWPPEAASLIKQVNSELSAEDVG